jgi:hypothetical protein
MRGKPFTFNHHPAYAELVFNKIASLFRFPNKTTRAVMSRAIAHVFRTILKDKRWISQVHKCDCAPYYTSFVLTQAML